MRYFNLSLICCSILLAIPSTSAADLVQDAGFEDLNSSLFWMAFGTADLDAPAPGIDPVEGTEVLQLVGNGDATFSIALQDIPVDGMSISVGDRVTLSGILGHTSNDPLGGSNTAFLEVSFVDAANNEFLDSMFQSARLDATSPTDLYLNGVTSSAIVPSNAVAVRVKAIFEELSVNDNGLSGSAFVDNVDLTVVSVPEPAAGLLIATGLAIFFARRKL